MKNSSSNIYTFQNGAPVETPVIFYLRIETIVNVGQKVSCVKNSSSNIYTCQNGAPEQKLT